LAVRGARVWVECTGSQRQGTARKRNEQKPNVRTFFDACQVPDGGEILMRCKKLAQAHERSYNDNAHLRAKVRIQDTRQLQRSMLGKCVRCAAGPSWHLDRASRSVIANCLIPAGKVET
jgi:hypothetical protein